MTTTIDPNLLILIGIGIVVVALLLWLLLRGRGGSADAEPTAPPAPRAPLEPVKPVIDLARPVDFSIPEPVAVPIATAPPPLPATAMAAPDGPADNLRRIKGLGPKLQTLLASLGVTRFEQIAAWSAEDIAAIDAHLGTFAGRIVRDDWVAQARLLADGDEAGFAARFGSLGGPPN